MNDESHRDQLNERDLLTKEQLADYDHYLLDKEELAACLGLKVRGVEMLVKERKIPAMRIGYKTLRFSLPRVLRALQKFELKEVG
jgi:excisionase family DNA binding protein